MLQFKKTMSKLTVLFPMEFCISEEKHYPDIHVSEFLPHVDRMHSDSDIGFSQEFDVSKRVG